MTPAFLDRDATVTKVVQLIEEVAAAGARQIPLLEAFVAGVIEERHSLDVTGHDARPDIFRLAVDDEPVLPYC